MLFPRVLTVVSFAALASCGLSQKKPLDHTVYDGWKSIRGSSLSRDGKWLAAIVAPQEGDATGTLRSTADGRTLTLARASAIQFSHDGKYALASLAPGFEETRKAKRDHVAVAAQPKGGLAVVDLATGTITTIERVAGFTLPREDSGWFAYRLEPPKPASPPTPKPQSGKADEGDQRGGRRRAGETRPEADAGATIRGATFVLRQLSTGKEERIESVDATGWDKTGRHFAYSIAPDKEGKGSLVRVRDLAGGTSTTTLSGIDKARYPKVALSDDGTRLAFTTDKDDAKAKKPALSLYVARADEAGTTLVPIPAQADSVNEGGNLRFTPSGRRLIFSTSKRPVAEPSDVPDDEKVSVDVWTYKDPQIMPQQILQAATERARGFQAIYDVASGKTTQIETPEMPSVRMGDEGDGPFGIAEVDLPYRLQATYDSGYSDLYAVDLRNGSPRRLFTRAVLTPSLSPDGRTAAVYLGEKKEWVAVDLASGGAISLSAKIPYPVYEELADTPSIAGPYGVSGWTKNGRVLLQDRYDLWLCDPKGVDAPTNLTGGRPRYLSFTPVSLDPDARTVDVDDLPLTVIDERTKAGGIYWRRGGRVERIFQADEKFGIVAKAADAETLVFTRQDTTEYPDLWLTDTRFSRPVKVTEANPQQKEYNWLKSELVGWTSSDGTPLQGILYKPEDFDYGKKYPMIAYFYERNSETLHNYLAPAPSASTINIPLFVSQGYLVFVPDIPYKTGAPGQSALSAIVPGVNGIVSRGYVDPKRLGIQGQSWGGYQVAYLVTATDMFACAEAGAPVSDMFSAYGGLRYGTGILRQGQYEHGQSRIGGTPWDSFLKYVDNSPVFHVDSIHTPLMIMSNDKDGAVPHTQGIEMYSAMRRFGKPCWMVVYNDEDHNLVQRKNRKDLSIRLSQYFDHFLKGTPMPVWMSEGVPAIQKGRTMGEELTKP